MASTTTLKLPEKLKARIARLAAQSGRSAHSVMLDALEREVTRAFALCDAGEVAAAASLAQRVLARSPDSAYALSLNESCAGTARLLQEMRDHTSNPER